MYSSSSSSCIAPRLNARIPRCRHRHHVACKSCGYLTCALESPSISVSGSSGYLHTRGHTHTEIDKHIICRILLDTNINVNMHVNVSMHIKKHVDIYTDIYTSTHTNAHRVTHSHTRTHDAWFKPRNLKLTVSLATKPD